MDERQLTKLEALLAPAPSLASPVRKSVLGRQYSCTMGHQIRFCDDTNEGTEFVSDISAYLPLLTPKLTKAGKVAVHQPHIPKQSSKWWKAQCGFRGLPVSGALSVLQSRLRNHQGNGMSDIVKEAQRAMITDYILNNRKAIEAVWAQADGDEKARLWPTRLIYEVLMASKESKHKILLVKVDNRGNDIVEAAKKMKVLCEIRKLPGHETGQRTAVIGRDRQVVDTRIADLDIDAQLVISKLTAKRKREGQEAADQFQRQFHSARSKKARQDVRWDICGEWQISCPYITEQYGEDDDDFSLEIRLTEPTETGLSQLYASFNFIVYTGIMRFINKDAQKDGNQKIQETKASLGNGGIPTYNDCSEGSETESADDNDDNDDDELVTPPEFLIPQHLLPSHRWRNWSYRWRGEETGEGVIEIGSDEHICSLTFESEDALSGTFTSDLTGTVDFTGFKIVADHIANESGQTPQKRSRYGTDPEYDWNSRSEAANERARVGRWH